MERSVWTVVRPLNKYAFILPAVLLTVGSISYPFIYNLLLSFYDTKVGTLDRFIGFSNYRALFSSSPFWEAVLRTIAFSFGTAIGAVILGLVLALCIHHLDLPGKTFLLGVLFVPWVMGFVESGIIARWVLHPVLGTVGQLINKALLSDPRTALATVTAVSVWKHIPFALVTVYAALQALRRDMYEAAMVDGANAWQAFRNITIPQLRPILFATGLLLVIWQFGAFTLIAVMTEGGPLHATEIVTVYIYDLFEARSFGKAAAASVVLFVLACILTVAYLKLEFKRLVEAE